MRKTRSRTTLHALAFVVAILVISVLFLPENALPIPIRDTTLLSKERLSEVARQTTGTLKEAGSGIAQSVGDSLKDAAGNVVRRYFAKADVKIRSRLDAIGESIKTFSSPARGAEGAKISIDDTLVDSPAELSVLATIKKNSPMDFLLSSSRQLSLRYEIFWGDGSNDSGTAPSGTSLSHQWSRQGSYEVRYEISADAIKKSGTFMVRVRE